MSHGQTSFSPNRTQFMSYGGSELGCMSTSEDIDIIAGYAHSTSPLLFRIKIESPMDRGASLKWLSIYPKEEEVLYPPLTYVRTRAFGLAVPRLYLPNCRACASISPPSRSAPVPACV